MEDGFIQNSGYHKRRAYFGIGIACLGILTTFPFAKFNIPAYPWAVLPAIQLVLFAVAALMVSNNQKDRNWSFIKGIEYCGLVPGCIMLVSIFIVTCVGPTTALGFFCKIIATASLPLSFFVLVFIYYPAALGEYIGSKLGGNTQKERKQKADHQKQTNYPRALSRSIVSKLAKTQTHNRLVDAHLRASL
jgi:hypothetical protein